MIRVRPCRGGARCSRKVLHLPIPVTRAYQRGVGERQRPGGRGCGPHPPAPLSTTIRSVGWRARDWHRVVNGPPGWPDYRLYFTTGGWLKKDDDTHSLTCMVITDANSGVRRPDGVCIWASQAYSESVSAIPQAPFKYALHVEPLQVGEAIARPSGAHVCRAGVQVYGMIDSGPIGVKPLPTPQQPAGDVHEKSPAVRLRKAYSHLFYPMDTVCHAMFHTLVLRT